MHLHPHAKAWELSSRMRNLIVGGKVRVERSAGSVVGRRGKSGYDGYCACSSVLKCNTVERDVGKCKRLSNLPSE